MHVCVFSSTSKSPSARSCSSVASPANFQLSWQIICAQYMCDTLTGSGRAKGPFYFILSKALESQTFRLCSELGMN